MLALEATLVEAVTALRAEGIEPLLLRGPAIARWLYDDGDAREHGDIDLLVPADRHAAAEAVLMRLGYRDLLAGFRASERVRHATPWLREGLLIDLHHRLRLVPDDPYAALAERASMLRVGNIDVSIPRHAALAVIIAVHVVHHGPAYPRPLEDLRRAVVRADDETWAAAAALARGLGAASTVASGLAMVDGGAALAARIGLVDRVDPVVQLQVNGAPALAGRLLELGRDKHRFARLLFDALVPSPALIRIDDPRARRGRIGLLGAYLARLRRGVVLLPAVVRHLRRIRRRDGG